MVTKMLAMQEAVPGTFASCGMRRDNRILQKTIERLTQYQYMADLGTCAIRRPLLDEWEPDVCAGRMPFRQAW